MENRFHELLTACRGRGVSDILLREDDVLHYRLRDEILPGTGCVGRELMQWLFSSISPGERVREGNGSLDSDLAYEYKGRYRINRYTSEGKLCATIRIIKDQIPTLAELGVNPGLPDHLASRRGLSLVVGKTGSGKSTTMAAVLSELLRVRPWHLITLEDPVEYRLDPGKGLVTQRESGRDFLTFQEGIRSALRQSPDFMMIGEIRDTASMRAVLEAAEAGIGVIATLHSLGAGTTLARILQMFPGSERDFVRFQLGETINFIQSQILRKNENGMELDYELLLGTQAVRNTISEGHFNQLENLIFLGQRQGMRGFQTPNDRNQGAKLNR